MPDYIPSGAAGPSHPISDDGLGSPRRNGGPGSYGGRAGQEGGAAGAGPHLVDYLRTVYKHRWIGVTAFTLVFAYMAIRTYTATPIYQGRVQLLVESVNPSVVNFKEVVQQDNYNYDFYPTQYAILKSRSLARRTIEALKMWESPEFGGGGKGDGDGKPAGRSGEGAAGANAAPEPFAEWWKWRGPQPRQMRTR